MTNHKTAWLTSTQDLSAVSTSIDLSRILQFVECFQEDTTICRQLTPEERGMVVEWFISNLQKIKFQSWLFERAIESCHGANYRWLKANAVIPALPISDEISDGQTWNEADFKEEQPSNNDEIQIEPILDFSKAVEFAQVILSNTTIMPVLSENGRKFVCKWFMEGLNRINITHDLLRLSIKHMKCGNYRFLEARKIIPTFRVESVHRADIKLNNR